MDPMKRRPSTMVVTISKLKSIRWKFCRGRGLGVTWAPSPHTGFSHTHYLPLPSPFHRDCPHSLTFIGLQLTQARKLPRGVEQDPEKGSGTVPGDKRVVCEHSCSNTHIPEPPLLSRVLSTPGTFIQAHDSALRQALTPSLCQIQICAQQSPKHTRNS